MADIVPYINLPKQYLTLREEIRQSLDEVFGSGSFILRSHVEEFEARIAELLGVQHVVGVNSGTDALYLSARALGLGPGDEVITVAHTFVATVASIAHCGAKPVLVDIRDDFNMDVTQLEQAISGRTRAIIPVHLNGRVCEMDTIMAVAQRHRLAVLEDAAQALCARYRGQAAGSFGNAGCFSLHPMKNLSVGGDGGFVGTNDADLADKLRLLRNHGQRSKEEIVCFGFNSRLDNLHAASALVKLKHLPQWNERRRLLARQYHEGLGGIPGLCLPPPPDEESLYYDVFSSYVVRTEQRDALQQRLEQAGIEVFAHWPIPLHHQRSLGLGSWHLPVTECLAQEVLSLPLYPELADEDQDRVIEEVRIFFEA